MQAAQYPVARKPNLPKKRAIRPPEASFQVRFFREAIKDLKVSKKLDITNTVRIAKDAVIVINHLVWESLERLYVTDEKAFFKHYDDGEPFELLTNSIQLTTRLFYNELFIQDALDADHPIFKSYRSRWYKNIRPFLLKCGYIQSIKNFRAGNYCSECEDGRGNFKLIINVKTFMFGNDLQIVGGGAVSDEVFLCPIDPLEKSYPYAQNNIQSEIEYKLKGESHESGEASPQSSFANCDEKEEKAHAKQDQTPVDVQKIGSKNLKNIAPSANQISHTPSVFEQDKSQIIVNFSAKLSQLFIKSLCKKEFLNESQIRLNKPMPIESLTIRDYTTDFVKLLKHCKQADEAEFSPAFDRLKKIIEDKPKWLQKDRARWIYTPDQYLSVEKYNGTTDFVMKEGSIRAYHDTYTVHARERITPSVSGDLPELLTTFYTKLKEFGVSDKFLKEWIEKLGKEHFVNEIRRCFARLAGGFKPLSKSEYIRRSIRISHAESVKEKANLAVKKVEMAQNQSQKPPNPPQQPAAVFRPSENQIKQWLESEFGEDAALFEKVQVYSLKTNGISPEILKREAYRLLKNIKQAEIDKKIVLRLLDENPLLADEIKQAHRHNRHQSLQEFTTDYLKQKFAHYFN